MKRRNRALVIACRAVYGPLFRRAARQILRDRLRDPRNPQRGRWLTTDVRKYLKQVWSRTVALLPVADLDALPTVGSRHNVILAAVTMAAYQELLERGVTPAYARELVADLGWKVYRWMLLAAALPVGLTTRDPGKRMARVLRALMVFPFRPTGAPGYEVKVWTEGDDMHTHWTHCPPHSFVRRLVEQEGDGGELEAFRQSWCRYDWPGADVLARDGEHGHYSRPHTLSHGDPVCDMCWHGRARGAEASKLEV